MATLQKKCKCANPDRCPHPWYDRVQKDGRRRWVRLTDTKSAAKRIADKKRGDRALVENGLPAETKTVRLLAFLIEKYLEHARADHPASAETKDAKALPTLLKALGNVDIATVTKEQIDSWRHQRLHVWSRGRFLGRSTVNRELITVKGCFSWAVKQGWLLVSPAQKVQEWKTVDVRRRILQTPEEFQTVADMPAPYNLINLMTLNYLPRLAEICSLSRDCLSPVHVRRCYIEVRRKGGRIDKIFIDPAHMTLLRAQLKTPDQVYLFPHHTRPSTRRTPRKWTKPWINPAYVSVVNTRYFRARGMVGIGNHALRHTGTTLHMTELHTDDSSLQVLGGWTSRRMLDVYGHATEKSVQAAALAGQSLVAQILAASTGPLAPQRKNGPRRGPARVARTA